MLRTRTALGLALGISAAALLAACDNGPSAVRAKSTAEASSASSSGGGSDARSGYASRDDRSAAAAPGVDHRKDEVKLVEGKPMWAASKRFSAEENAQHSFERNGEAFGAGSIDQFIKKAHAFVDHPPKGTLTLTRANGDTLFYDPKGNVFAVASKSGAPRTMFKPDDGMAYWEKQKDREQHRQASRRSKRGDDGEA